jgi:two-component system response regulator FixJ
MSSRTVYLVDDDAKSRAGLLRQLGELQLEAWPFAGAAAFAEMLPSLDPSCILFGATMDEKRAPAALDGVALLARGAPRWPLIVLAAGGETRTAVEAMKRGATDYLQQPLASDRLGAAIEAAGLLVDGLREAREARRHLETRLASLTPRECDVARALLAGMGNKAAAFHLGLSVRTVEMHRSRMLHKLGARTIAEGAALLAQAGLAPGPARPAGESGDTDRDRAGPSAFPPARRGDGATAGARWR